MKRFLQIIVISIFFIGCNRVSDEEKITNLNGYWEIKTVTRPEGMHKEYKISPYIDYIEIENMTGFRQKVKPKLTGGFFHTGDREDLTVKIENDSINLYYETPFDSWKETLLSSGENEIKISNPQGIIYTYKRFTPYLETDGETNK